MNLRILTLVLTTALLAVTAPALGVEARLNARVVVDGGVVTLGDVLDEAGPAADAVISRSPAPGERIVIRVSHIYAVARANGLDWKPIRGLDRVVVSRASQRIPLTQIEDRLTEALRDVAPGENFRVELSRRTQRIDLPIDVPATLDVENLSLDQRSGRFTATLVAALGTHGAVRADVAGRAIAVIDVPVLRRPVRRDEIIVERDLKWTEVRVDRLPAAIITDPADLIGLAARRTLKAGKPIRAGDVGLPLAVTKGASVLITFRTPTMVLTVTGRALQSGAKGETIRVLNTTSNTTIEARIEGGNLVTVMTRQTIAMN